MESEQNQDGTTANRSSDRTSRIFGSRRGRRRAITNRPGAGLLRCAAVIVLAAGLGPTLTGCGTTSEPPAATTQTVYYTAADDLPLFRDPGANPIVRLPLHTKVVRDNLQRGYAHVRVEATGQQGWIDNAKLIWRVPSASPPEQKAAPAAPRAEPMAISVPSTEPTAGTGSAQSAGSGPAPTATVPAAGAAPTPKAPPPRTSTQSPSIFNPF